MAKVKICGITNLEDALIAEKAKADFLGFIFAKSPRKIGIDSANAIFSKLSSDIKVVGVFVNEDEKSLKRIVKELPRLDYLQLHGDETPDYCNAFNQKGIIKVFRIKDKDSIRDIEEYRNRVDIILLDTFSKENYGGTGKVFDWEVAKAALDYEIPVILSGGLTPDNVKKAVQFVEPYAVDVSGGVETSFGKKDSELIKKFIKIVKG